MSIEDMMDKPSYEELQRRVIELEKTIEPKKEYVRYKRKKLLKQDYDALAGFYEKANESMDRQEERIKIKKCRVKELYVDGFHFKKFSDLKNLQLEKLDASATRVHDLSFLTNMPLLYLDLSYSNIRDISDLKGLNLKYLNLEGNTVIDISALENMPLETLNLNKTRISYLKPLKGMPLKKLYLPNIDRFYNKEYLDDLNSRGCDINFTS